MSARPSAATAGPSRTSGPTTSPRSSWGRPYAGPASSPALIDEVVLGAANQAGEDNRNVARMAVLLAGFPDSVPGFTVNRLCASGLTAVATARQMIAAGDADLVVAGGVESMTRAPWVTEKPSRAFAKPGASYDTSIGWRFPNPRFDADTTLSMPQTAERVAEQWRLTREELDAFALRSHERAIDAIEERPVRRRDRAGAGQGRRVRRRRRTARRHQPRGAGPAASRSTTPTAWSPPATPSSLNDGAAAVVVASERFVAEHGLDPRARIVAAANAGVDPSIMGIGPVPATRKVLERSGWSADDLDAVELNEAFASQSIACIRDLGLDDDIVNADGGAIALGHPLGCSGTRLLVTLLGRLERTGGRRGLATMCVGVGQGSALLVERV